jgi:plastocyanin
MNSLDSRFCRVGDTFAQKFSQAGRYTYDFNLPGLNQLDNQTGRFTISVGKADDKKAEAKQHFVTVRVADKKLVADPPNVEIAAGDVVLWNTNDQSTPGFSVSGHSEKDSFNSAALAREALYSHAFGSPEEIEWTDMNGHGLHGKITVRMPSTKSQKEMDDFKGLLTTGTVVTIRDGKAEPAQLSVMVGQTVFFAVEKAEGITITDRRLKIEIPVVQ